MLEDAKRKKKIVNAISKKKKIIWKKYGLATRTRWIANFLAEPKKARDSKIIYLNDIEQRLKMGM